jgi:hypothetical protein
VTSANAGSGGVTPGVPGGGAGVDAAAPGVAAWFAEAGVPGCGATPEAAGAGTIGIEDDAAATAADAAGAAGATASAPGATDAQPLANAAVTAASRAQEDFGAKDGAPEALREREEEVTGAAGRAGERTIGM